MEKFAKAPFFHGGLNLDNIFVLTMIFVTIFYLCINLLRKKEFSLANYFQVGIVFSTLILEQKNIIRTIDGQLTFIGLVMVVLLMAEIRNKFIKSIKFDKKYLYFLIIIYLIRNHANA